MYTWGLHTLLVHIVDHVTYCYTLLWELGRDSLYTKVVEENIVVICLYVDGMLIIGTDLEIEKSAKKFLLAQLSMKDLGTADVILKIL